MIRYKQWLCYVACEARSRWSSMRGLHFFYITEYILHVERHIKYKANSV